MLYQEAVASLMNLNYVTRPCWEAEGGYLVRVPGITHFLKVSMQPKPQVVPWAADIESSSATDWVEVDANELVKNVVVVEEEAK